MPLHSLVYVSIESRPMTVDDIRNILDKARAFNTSQDITGMLLYRGGYFIQALEGEKERVQALFDKIARDDRHQNVLKVYNAAINERAFGSWSMGFKDLDGIDPAGLEGYTDFLMQPITPQMIGDGSRAKAFLELFKEESTY
ncbi:MAG: BLUF domain-containing protein [bacterium]|nr:BLUF domain-containing protein [bacterium]